MFGTLSYDAQTQEPVFEAVTTLPNSITGAEPSKRGSTIHKACQLCRARKLRCSGEPSGCERCKSSFSICRYPPRSSRPSRRRDPTSPRNVSSKSQDPLVDGYFSPIEGDSTKGARPHDMFWQEHAPAESSAQGFQPLSTSRLAAIDQGLVSPQSQSFLVDDYVFNAEDYSFKDYFGASWQAQDVFESKTTSNLISTSHPNLQLSLPTYDRTSLHKEPASNCTTPDLEGLEIVGPEAMLGRTWSVASVEKTPELSSRASLSRSTSVETIGMYRDTSRGDQGRPENNENCHCLGQVARLLEDVEAGNAKMNASLDELLECTKEPLGRRKALLACKNCNSRPEYTLMLAMLAKSLSAVCHRLVQSHLQGQVEGDGGDTTGAGWPDLKVGTYSIQDSMERFKVVEALIATKLRCLLDLITSLKVWAEGRDGVQVFLLQAEERAKKLTSQIGQRV